MLERSAIRFAASAWLAAAILYLASEALTAAAFSPSYSYAQNYVSDLGVRLCGAIFDGRPICSPLHVVMNADFIVQGVLFAAAAIAVARALSTPARHVLVVCATLNGIGICLVGLCPEGEGPLLLHGLGAVLAIVFGNATAAVSSVAFRELRLPRFHRLASLALPVLALVGLAMLLTARERGTALLVPDGIWERTSIYTITAWELLTGACLLAGTPGVGARGRRS